MLFTDGGVAINTTNLTARLRLVEFFGEVLEELLSLPLVSFKICRATISKAALLPSMVFVVPWLRGDSVGEDNMKFPHISARLSAEFRREELPAISSLEDLRLFITDVRQLAGQVSSMNENDKRLSGFFKVVFLMGSSRFPRVVS